MHTSDRPVKKKDQWLRERAKEIYFEDFIQKLYFVDFIIFYIEIKNLWTGIDLPVQIISSCGVSINLNRSQAKHSQVMVLSARFH